LIGVGTWGIDFWQANHFIVHRPETAGYLYGEYTPKQIEYRKGTLPKYERVVAEYTAGVMGDREKAVALLTKALPRLVVHPAMPPLGPVCQTNRDLLDEPLLDSGKGYCNEQARVFVRLCQVAGIPARMIFLFYADRTSGHVVAEFLADGRWCMADNSWFCVFPDVNGRLMSAAECHGNGKALAGEAYFTRFRELLALSDEELVGGKFVFVPDPMRRRERIRAEAAVFRKNLGSRSAEALGNELWAFGVLNYPLPN
jgi:hypothetical protein